MTIVIFKRPVPEITIVVLETRGLSLDFMSKNYD